MVDSIATSIAGLQKYAAQASALAVSIATNPDFISGGIQDIVDIGGQSGEGAAVAAASAPSLEASIVSLKSAALLYEANAKVLSIALETQKEAFEELI